MNVLLDTDVLLDVLLDREPFSQPASEVLAMTERGPLRGFVAASSVTTLYYLCAKAHGSDAARQQVQLLLSILEVAPVDRGVLDAALNADFGDFEDAVVASAASRVSAELVFTRNLRDFKNSPVPARSPTEFVAAVRAGDP